VIFFSPSAVESFFSMNTVTASLPLFAIGQTTAAAIREHTNNPVVIAAEPDAALLIRQVIDHFEINK
jgi:uroporphyrinogen-III synthase